ncbi:MAG: aminopeptidase P family protein [Candidatus Saccharibacteria bacterium]
MQSHFPSAFFVANRQRLRELVKSSAPIVVTANGLLQRGADGTFPFAQDANFWYLTGIDEPDITLVMADRQDYLIVPGRDASRMAFDGQVDDDKLKACSGISTILDTETGWEKLTKAVAGQRQVATIGVAPMYLEHYGMYTNPARRRMQIQLKAACAHAEIVDIGQHIVGLRMLKQPAELLAIQAAVDITVATIQEVTQSDVLSTYQYEYQLEADITRGFRRRGASGHAFEPIVAGGARACTLHNVANNSPLKRNELIVLDVGAEVEHYAADITRTVNPGRSTPRQLAVHAAVQDVQSYAAGLLKPGILLADYEGKVEHYLGKKLQELGLIKAITHDAVRHYYPHASSHFMGLNVHDAGDYGQPLQPGMVITVEPGIYITEESIGVRIEDDVLITADGNVILSNKLSRNVT